MSPETQRIIDTVRQRKAGKPTPQHSNAWERLYEWWLNETWKGMLTDGITAAEYDAAVAELEANKKLTKESK